MNMRCEKNEPMPFLPRFGIRLFMPNDFETVEYFGYGPYESYVDKHRASWLGKFKTTVRDNHEDYIKPQENGSHWGCDYVCVQGIGEKQLTAFGDEPISFGVSEYTQEELTQKKHNFELTPSGYTVLCLDYRLSGIGSNSCGPALEKPYRMDANTFSCTFTIAPKKESC